MNARRRLDGELVRRGLAESRARADELIRDDRVLVNGAVATKPARQVAPGDAIVVEGPPPRFVGRGAEKLDHALDEFGIDVTGLRFLDAGASTGGFTDVLLQGGAEHVFAVDSGTNQLAWKLREDPRVTVYEQTSARLLTPELIDRPCDMVVCDASFIALSKVLDVPLQLAAPRCRLVALIKPQFEVEKHEDGKGGVVRDAALHNRVCDEVREWLEGLGWEIEGLVESPITGPKGNVEFLLNAGRS